MLDGKLRRVAILIDSLDQLTAQQMLARMPAARAAEVRNAIRTLQDVDPLERKSAIADFMQKSHSDRQSPTTPLASAPIHENQTTTATPSANPPSALSFLSEYPTEKVVGLLAEENPQLVAIVLASVTSELAANFISRLPSDIRPPVVARLAKLNVIPEVVVDEVAQQLKALLGDAEAAHFAGGKTLTSIISRLDGAKRGELLADLATHDPRMVAEISDSLTSDQEDTQSPEVSESASFVADEIEKEPSQSPSSALPFGLVERLHPDDLRRVLSNLNVQTAVLSLCGMRPKVVSRLLATLPKEQKALVQGKLKKIGTVELRSIDQAQADVAAEALRMHNRGELASLDMPKRRSGRQMSYAA